MKPDLAVRQWRVWTRRRWIGIRIGPGMLSYHSHVLPPRTYHASRGFFLAGMAIRISRDGEGRMSSSTGRRSVKRDSVVYDDQKVVSRDRKCPKTRAAFQVTSSLMLTTR